MYLLDVLEEHAEEAGFLWMQRQRALRPWNYTLKDLADLEERLIAHLDGLLIGEDAAAKILEPYLTEGEEGEAFAAAFVALASGDPARLNHVFEVFEQAVGETLDGIRHAMRHTSHPDVVNRVTNYWYVERTELVAVAIDVLSFRRCKTPYLASHLAAEQPVEVRAAALEAAGRMGDRMSLPAVEASFTNGDASVQRAALQAGFILGSEQVLVVCRDLVARRAVNADEAVHLLGLAGDPADKSLIWQAVGDKILQPHAILALGAHGYADVIAPLLEYAEYLEDLRGVGCVVSRITGVDIEDDDLESWAEVEASRRGVEPSVEDLEEEFTDFEDLNEGLPPPDLDKLTAWWSAKGDRFDPGTRLNAGQPIDRDLAQRILTSGLMPTRDDAAFDLARAQGGVVASTSPFQMKLVS